MKRKNILVSWTGGLDSTYLVYKLLNEGHLVNTCYTKILYNTNFTKRERKAISKMIVNFKKYPNYLGHLESESVGYFQNVCFGQVLCILQGLIHNYKEHDEVAIGYVMNDDIISYLPDIKKIWDSYKTICYSNFPKLTFPLIKYSKDMIYNNLPKIFLDNISYCQRLDDVEEPCGVCRSCKRMKDVLEEINKDTDVTDIREIDTKEIEIIKDS